MALPEPESEYEEFQNESSLAERAIGGLKLNRCNKKKDPKICTQYVVCKAAFEIIKPSYITKTAKPTTITASPSTSSTIYITSTSTEYPPHVTSTVSASTTIFVTQTSYETQTM
jgi:hypothetical protein